MGHHYIPRSYLKGFTEEEDSSMIFRYEKGSSQIIRTNIKNVAQETGFYSEETESILANVFETPSRVILDLLRAHQPISEEQRCFFTDYMVVMMRRGPTSRDEVIEFVNENFALTLDQLEGAVNRYSMEYPDKHEVLNKRREEIKITRGKQESFARDVWYKLLFPENYPQMKRAIQSMTWRLMVTREDQFLTSDYPFFFFKEIGLGKPISEFFFPISARVGLWGTWMPRTEIIFQKATESFVHEMNRRTVSAATRYIFFSKRDRSILNLVNKPKLHLRSLIDKRTVPRNIPLVD